MLIIDDDDLIRRSVAALLALSKIRVIQAASGREALEVARREKPDIVLCDLTMPEMHGMEVCAAFRADPELRACRFVILSARADDVESPTVRDADAFLNKPFTPRELEALILRLRALPARA